MVIGEIDPILGQLGEDRDFEDVVKEIWLRSGDKETLNIPEYARLYFSHETQSDDGIYASYDSVRSIVPLHHFWSSESSAE